MVKPLVPSFAGNELEGGVALVTGAGVGLGRAEAIALARAGAKVVVNDLTDAAEAVAAEITAAGGEAIGIAGDIGDWGFAGSLVKTAVDTYGDLNVLVNNAGVLRDKMVFSLSADDWDLVLRVHLRGHAATCNAATAYWRAKSKAAEAPVWARVVNTTSEAYILGPAGQPNYGAAKAGITSLTMSIVNGCSRYGVQANAIAPRARTSMTEAVFRPAPDGDVIDPWAIEHVVPVVVWLGTKSSTVTGQVFVTYSGKIGVMAPPQLDASFEAAGETWTVEELDTTVGGFLADGHNRGYFVPSDFSIS